MFISNLLGFFIIIQVTVWKIHSQMTPRLTVSVILFSDAEDLVLSSYLFDKFGKRWGVHILFIYFFCTSDILRIFHVIYTF